MAILADNVIGGFTPQTRGQIVLPADPAYDEVRKIWNAMSERRPGGHNIAGNAVCDDGLMIDLSQMKSVRIDPGKRLAYVEPDAMGYTRPREFNSSFR